MRFPAGTRVLLVLGRNHVEIAKLGQSWTPVVVIAALGSVGAVDLDVSGNEAQRKDGASWEAWKSL
jgi:hypothetical protein